jgi:hypothetical protein
MSCVPSPRPDDGAIRGLARELVRGSPEFLVELVPDRERVVVCPAGEVDIATAGHLEQAIIEMMERGFERWSWISRR